MKIIFYLFNVLYLENFIYLYNFVYSENVKFTLYYTYFCYYLLCWVLNNVIPPSYYGAKVIAKLKKKIKLLYQIIEYS